MRCNCHAPCLVVELKTQHREQLESLESLHTEQVEQMKSKHKEEVQKLRVSNSTLPVHTWLKSHTGGMLIDASTDVLIDASTHVSTDASTHVSGHWLCVPSVPP